VLLGQELISNNSLDVLDHLDGSKLKDEVEHILNQSADKSINAITGLKCTFDCSQLLSNMVDIFQAAKEVVDLDPVKQFKGPLSAHDVVDNLPDEDHMNSSGDGSLEDTEPLTDIDYETLVSVGQDSSSDSNLFPVSTDATSLANGNNGEKLLPTSVSVLCDSTSEKQSKIQHKSLMSLESISRSLSLSLTPALTFQSGISGIGKSASLSTNNISPGIPMTSSTACTAARRNYVFKEVPHPFTSTSDTLSLGGSHIKRPLILSSPVPKERQDDWETRHDGEPTTVNGHMMLKPVRSTYPSRTVKVPVTSQANSEKSQPSTVILSSAESDTDDVPPESHYDNCGLCSSAVGDEEVVHCASCPLVFHWACVNLTNAPENDWKCKVCGTQQPEPNSINLCNGDEDEDPYTPIIRLLLDHPNSVAMKESDSSRLRSKDKAKSPTDLNAIAQKLLLGRYSLDRRQFVVDVRHIFVTCSRIHKPWTIEAAMGRRMSMLFEQLLAQCPMERLMSDAKRSRRE
jgi:hypothetical protein